MNPSELIALVGKSNISDDKDLGATGRRIVVRGGSSLPEGDPDFDEYDCTFLPQWGLVQVKGGTIVGLPEFRLRVISSLERAYGRPTQTQSVDLASPDVPNSPDPTSGVQLLTAAQAAAIGAARSGTSTKSPTDRAQSWIWTLRDGATIELYTEIGGPFEDLDLTYSFPHLRDLTHLGPHY